MNSTLIITIKNCDINRIKILLANAFIRHGLESTTIIELKDEEIKNPLPVDNLLQKPKPP